MSKYMGAYNHKEIFLILICGLPGTGKSTAAQKLVKELEGYVLIDQNEVRRKHDMKRMPKTQDRVLREIDRMTSEHLSRDTGVIFESGNRHSFRRHQMYGIASGCGRRVITLEMVCEENTSKARMRARPVGDDLISDPIDPKVYDRIASMWEDVDVDFRFPGEDHVTYIQFDSERNICNRVIVRPRMQTILARIEKILTIQ